MADLDVVLLAPGGNQVVLFNDIGSSCPAADGRDAGRRGGHSHVNLYTVISGMDSKPPLARRLDWFDYQYAGGTWTLQVYDDLANNGGTLQSWGVTICEPPPPPSLSGGLRSGDRLQQRLRG
jgi:hypothetical protein